MAKGNSKRGRKSKTNNEKKILGVKKSRINPEEPDLISVAPEIPDWDDSLNALGKSIFQKYCKMLFANGTIGKTDEFALYQLALAIQLWHHEHKICNQHGRNIVYKDKAGNIKGTQQASWAKNEAVLWERVYKMHREFGMTPLSRGACTRLARGKDTLDIPQIT